MPVYLDAIHDYELDKLECIIERALKELDFSFFGARDAVIKPNIVQALAPETAAVTHPVFVEAIINVLRDYGVRQITIAEAPALGIPAASAFAAAGYQGLALRQKVRLVNLMDAPRTQVHAGYGYENVPNTFDDADLSDYYCGYLSIPNIVLESDIYVNVPKLKMHNRTGVTVSMKNQWGLLSYRDRQTYHRVGLHEPIAQLAKAVKPHLNIVDGVLAMEGNGPILGKPVAMGAVVVGRNAVETDIVAANLTGTDPRSVTHIRQAVDFGLADWAVEVRGERIEDLASALEPAPADFTKNKQMYAWKNHRSCFLDDMAFVKAAWLARRHPRYWMYFLKLAYYKRFGRIDILHGRGMKMPQFKRGQKVILSGDCSKDLLENYEEIPANVIHIPGCPPEPEDIIRAIIRM